MNALEILKLQFLLLLLVVYGKAERVMRPKFKDIKVWSDNNYVKHDVVFDENAPYMNITIHALRELNDIDVHVDSSVVHKDNENHFIKFNTTFSFCRMLSWRDQSPIGNIVYNYFREYGKLAESCPLAKGKYYLHKFWMPEDPATALLPEVNFVVNVGVYHVDAQNQRTLITDDTFTGEAVVQEVNNVKRANILSMLPMNG